jgi:glycosyltransferase involved in cell wall biosynthesis
VSVTGFVSCIEEELASADLVIVPLRFGSGTRIKILEAFAHRIPVVGTTLGAEGLDVVDGTHMMIGDTPDGLAAACAEVLSSSERRAGLVEKAQRLFLDQYQWSRISESIVELANTLARTPRPLRSS